MPISRELLPFSFQFCTRLAAVFAKEVSGFAASWGHNEIVELLIAKGADVNVKSSGKTPLDWAIKQLHPETADLLRKHGGKTGAELKAERK